MADRIGIFYAVAGALALCHSIKASGRAAGARLDYALQNMNRKAIRDALRALRRHGPEAFTKPEGGAIMEAALRGFGGGDAGADLLAERGRQRAERFARGIAAKLPLAAAGNTRETNPTAGAGAAHIALPQTVRHFDNLAADLRGLARDAFAKARPRVAEAAMRTIADGWEAGKGTAEIGRALRETLSGVSRRRLEGIARTVLHNATGRAGQATFADFGVQYQQWQSTGDERTRETHEELQGEIVAVGGRFSNGLLFPGDSSGPPEEWQNCRCRAVPFFMPHGKAAPIGKPQFREDELENTAAPGAPATVEMTERNGVFRRAYETEHDARE